MEPNLLLPNSVALERPDISDVSQSLHDLLWKKHRRAYQVTWAFCIALGVAIFVGIYAAGDRAIASFSNNDMTIFLPFIPLLIPLSIQGYFDRKLEHEFMAQIATAIGFTYSPSLDGRALEGMLFAVGSNRKASDVLSGSYKGYPMRICNYRYAIRRGKSTITLEETVFQLIYSAPLPHVLVNPPDTGDALFEGIPKDLEPVQLEGDFSAHASVYAAHEAQVSVREIFQPDVMQEWLDAFRTAHFETIGNSVCLMSPGEITNKDKFLSMRDMMDHLLDNIIPGLRAAASD